MCWPEMVVFMAHPAVPGRAAATQVAVGDEIARRPAASRVPTHPWPSLCAEVSVNGHSPAALAQLIAEPNHRFNSCSSFDPPHIPGTARHPGDCLELTWFHGFCPTHVMQASHKPNGYMTWKRIL